MMTKFYLLTGIVAILVGYVDLWRGGTALAACLLVAGYVVLLPAAIAPRSRGEGTRTGEREPPPYAAAAGVFAAVLAVYVATLAPTTAMWDASEYIAVAKVLGLPHPPGNPMFVLLAHVAGLVPLPVEYAVRINLLAAAASAASAALWFLCAERMLRAVVAGRRRRMVAAGACALLGATAFTVWNQSVVNEKVYTVSLLGLTVGSWLVVRWLDATGDGQRDDARADRLLVLLAYAAGVAYTVHPAGLLAAPAAAAAVLARRPRTILRWRLHLALAGALAVGLTPFAVEPIRSAHMPPINEGLPTACEGGRPELSCTLSAETWRRLSANIQRKQYGGHAVMERQAPFGAQLSMFWQYFRWQWLRDADGDAARLQRLAALAYLALGIAGLVVLRRRDRASWWYFAPLAATLTVGLVYYLNFKYGWSQLADDARREVRERDYFFIWSFSAWGLLAGVGLAAAWRALATRLEDRGARAAWALAAPVLLLALVPLAANHRDASRAGQRFTREWAADLLASVEPNAILVTNGDNDSFPLWYAQEVEGIRRDVTVALTPYLGLPWYARELQRRAPLWRLSTSELDTVPDYVQLGEPQRFRHGEIDATIPAGVLTRDQLLVLRAIKDGFPQRPIYFSIGGYPQALGLAPYIRRVGLVQKLEPRALTESADLVAVGDAHLDVTRTLQLWDSTYRGHRQMIEEGRWMDAPSSLIPTAYAFVGQQLAGALAVRGDTARALDVMETARKVARAAGAAGEQ